MGDRLMKLATDALKDCGGVWSPELSRDARTHLAKVVLDAIDAEALEEIRQRVADGWCAAARPQPQWVNTFDDHEPMFDSVAALLWPGLASHQEET